MKKYYFKFLRNLSHINPKTASSQINMNENSLHKHYCVRSIERSEIKNSPFRGP